MDIQLCLNYFAVITYISDYYSKDDSGTLHHIKEALKNSEDDTLRSKLSLVANTFLTHRQIGECEAYFRIIPNLTLKSSNIEAMFIPTGFKKNRSRFLKRVTEEEAKKCTDVIVLDDRKGLYIEKPSLLDKYERRDIEINQALDYLSYLQFGKRYTASNKEPMEGELKSNFILKCSDKAKDLKSKHDLDIIVTE